MNYVVVDLEWNQALSSSSPVFNKLPIHLRGEIIEIGAVKLTEDMKPSEELSIDVKPVYFRKMHYKVKKITGIDRDRLDKGMSFPDAFDIFRAWCGEDVTFITWGCDDQSIMEQNIIIHDLDWDWIHEWVNLQLIYNLQTDGGKEQKSLQTAMEHFSIEQTRVAHDALGDAYNTALVCSHLDMKDGLKLYPEAQRILSERVLQSKQKADPDADISALDIASLNGLESKAAAFNSELATSIPCPICHNNMKGSKWINQGDQRYINLFKCEQHGSYFIRFRFKKHPDDNIWDVKRIIYEADESKTNIYNTKLKQFRRRGRNHTDRKNRPA